jgi:hypothetical protein
MENNNNPLIKPRHIGRELIWIALIWVGYSAYHFWKHGLDYRSLAIGIILVASIIWGYFILRK